MGSNYPIMNLHQRVLSVLTNRVRLHQRVLSVLTNRVRLHLCVDVLAYVVLPLLVSYQFATLCLLDMDVRSHWRAVYVDGSCAVVSSAPYTSLSVLVL